MNELSKINLGLKMNEKQVIQLKELFDYFHLKDRVLSASQSAFIRSCKTQFQRNKELTEKQIQVLNDIKNYING